VSRPLPLGSPNAPLPGELDIAIIGGGIMGLSTAYELAKLSRLRIAVIERSYLVSGASGRNGGGVRMQWGNRGNVELMMRSIAICRGLAQELDINLWFRQGGYLFLARTRQDEARLVRNAELHRDLGAATELLTPQSAAERVAHLDVTGVRLASFNPDDGVVFPWPFVWGYAAQALKRGVTIRTHTAVTRVEPQPAGLVLELSSGEKIRATKVINATGAWSTELNRQLGIDLPNHPHRHEILSSEPLKPFLDPLVVDLSTGLYCSQSTRGEIVAGVTMPGEGGTSLEVDLSSSLAFLHRVARALCAVFPMARDLKVLRQWAGPYDLTPDGDAIVGPSPNLPAFIQLCGFTGHGFMMAPAVGQLLARWLARGESHPMLGRWDPSRFARGPTAAQEDMIIG
jgi:sarcosine oxidase subunit beta